MKELLKKLRNYEIRIRMLIKSRMQGDFHSVFKGSGLEFDDVRSYQYGDDVRSINWNISAKGHDTYVNTFKEEKEQTVFFIVDVSASQEIGQKGRRKIDVATEICGLLALTAVSEQSQIGMLCFSDVKERYVKPAKGIRHAYELISVLFELAPKSLQTDLKKAFLYALGLLKKKSVIIIISDFIDTGFETMLKALASKHDVVAIQISDRKEVKLPALGIIPVYDTERAMTVWMNTSSSHFKDTVKKMQEQNHENLEEICRKYRANYTQVFTHEDFIPKLISLFKVNHSRGN